MSAEIVYGIDFKGLAESRLPPEEVGSVVAWPISVRDTAPSEMASLQEAYNMFRNRDFIAPDGDSA